MALTLCRNWFSTECQVYVFSLQTVIRPAFFYKLSTRPLSTICLRMLDNLFLKNTTIDFVETFLPPMFFYTVPYFIVYELTMILPCSADLKPLLRRSRSRTHCRVFSSYVLSSPFMFISFLFFILCPFKSFHVHLISFHFHLMSFQVLSCSSSISFHFNIISFQILSCSSHFLSCSSHFPSSPFMFISFPFKSFHVHLISFHFHRISFQVLSCSSHFLSSPFMFISLPCCKFVVQ